jgi:hypothetical protein
MYTAQITKVILKAAAAKLAKIVFTGLGNFFIYTLLCNNASIPALAAVSPNLAMGPWKRAARRP